jgi:DNA-binding CsgD family transcriptional regulator/tetratricopeptide (TPR) repeat protein
MPRRAPAGGHGTPLEGRAGRPATLGGAGILSGVSASWRITGRERELSRAGEVLADGRGGLLILGPAGLGKSRLAQELAERAAADGAEVAHLAGSQAGANLTLAAVAPLLPPEVADASVPVLVLLRRALEERAEGRRIVLVVDDTHLLDDASALLVHQLAASGGVQVIATQRAGVLAPDPVVRLIQDRLVERLELGPLDRAGTVDLAELIAGERLEPAAEERLWHLTAGNPLFVREVLLSLADSGVAGSDLGRRLLDPDAVGVPRLVDLVRHRLADLGDVAHEAMVQLAFGEPLGPGELAGLVGDDTIARLDRDGLLDSSLDGKRLIVRLAHPLYGEVLRADTSALQRRAIRYRLAEALQATGARRRADVVRLAAWATEGGLEVPVATLAEAARVARFSHDHDLAERLARAAFVAEPTFGAGEVLADVLFVVGDIDGLEEHLPGWEDVCADDDQRAVVAMSRAIGAYWRRSDDAAAWAALDAVGDVASASARDEVVALRSTLLAFAGRPAEALTLATPLLEREPDRVLIQAALAANQAHRASGQPLVGLAVVQRALEAYTVLGEQAILVSNRVVAAARASTLTDAGRYDEATDAVRLALDSARDAGEGAGVALASLSEGWLLMHQGRTESARRSLALADRAFGANRHPGMQRWTKAALALTDAIRGELVAARSHLDALDELGPHPAKVFEGSVHRARAAVAWLDNRPADAHQVLADGADERRAAGDVLGEAACLHDLARLGRPDDAAARLADLVLPGSGIAIPAMAAHAAALASGSVAQLGEVAEAFASMGAWLWAAEAAFSASDAARNAGDQRAAARWANLGDDHRARCESVHTPGLVTTTGPVPLTRREREVAILAAQGLPSREIGERLFVGKRTVESHLARIYGKLGIRSRVELARMLDGGREAIVA